MKRFRLFFCAEIFSANFANSSFIHQQRFSKVVFEVFHLKFLFRRSQNIFAVFTMKCNYRCLIIFSVALTAALLAGINKY